MAFTPGIDVSLYQKQINWAQVYAAGNRFAFIKASQGVTVVDPMFETNWAGAKAAGLVVGVYHFVNPMLAAADQITHLLQVLGDRHPDLPIALDIEKPVDSDPADVTAVVTDFVTTLTQRIGRQPLIYTGPSYWNDHIHGGPNWATYDLWIANYGPSTPNLPKAWQTWRFWQYSGTGATAGVPAQVDLDWFNGSEDDLKAYVQQSGGTVAPVSTSAPAQTAATPSAEFPKTMYIIAPAGLNLRQSPSTTATILQKIPHGTAIQVESGVSGLFVQISSPAAGWVAQGDGTTAYISATAP